MLKIKQISNIFFVLLLAFVFSCEQKEDSNAVKELLQAQKEALQAEKSKVDEQFKKMQSTEDSLKGLLEIQEQELSEKLIRLETEKDALETDKKEQEINNVKRLKQLQREKLEATMKTLFRVNSELAELKNKKESLTKHIAYLKESVQRSKQSLRTEMTDVDSLINTLENEKRIEQKKIPILKKKVTIAATKIQAYKDERDLFDELKTNKIRVSASENEIAQVEEKITSIDEAIGSEQKTLAEAQVQITSSENRIDEIESQLKKLNQLIRSKYDKEEVLSEFTESELNRIIKELDRVENEEIRLTQQKNILEKGNENLVISLTELDNEQEYLSTRHATDIAVATENQDLSREDKSITENDQDTLVVSADEQTSAIEQLSKISDETAQTAKVKDDGEINNPDESLSGNGIWKKLITIIIVLTLVILTVLFFVGKSTLSKAKK